MTFDYEALPKKRAASGALVFFGDEMLIVKPSYRDGWLIPGGVVESDESPKQACIREMREELGLDIAIERLLAVDYACSEAGESFQFIFLAQTVARDRLLEIRLPPDEIAEYRLLHPDAALGLLIAPLRARVLSALRALELGGTLYLERGVPA